MILHQTYCSLSPTPVILRVKFECGHQAGLSDIGPQGFWGSGEKGYLFSGSWGALLIILGELGSKHILLGILGAL